MNKYGVVIRSVGERTEKLCIESVKKGGIEPFIIKNISPHLKATMTMYEVMLKNPSRYWLSVDADVILRPDWIDFMDELVKDSDHLLCCHPKGYEFIMNKIWHRGCRTYNGKYIQQCYDNIIHNYDKALPNLFPEDAARRMIPGEFKNNIVKEHIFLAWHGCEQYYTHIYNAYVRYAIRTNGAKDEKTLYRNFRKPIKPDHPDRVMAIRGWDDGCANSELAKTKDFKNYIKIEPEKKPCNMTLEEFYDKYKEFIK